MLTRCTPLIGQLEALDREPEYQTKKDGRSAFRGLLTIFMVAGLLVYVIVGVSSVKSGLVYHPGQIQCHCVNVPHDTYPFVGMGSGYLGPATGVSDQCISLAAGDPCSPECQAQVAVVGPCTLKEPSSYASGQQGNNVCTYFPWQIANVPAVAASSKTALRLPQ